MRKWLLLLFLLAVAVVGWFRAPLTQWCDGVCGVIKIHQKKRLEPNPQAYLVLVSELHRWREELSARHQNARNADERVAAEHDARVILELVLPQMMRCWLGTPYDFNGTASKPGDGKIACGYFVATVLMDAGFRVNRYDLAKQPSENILRSFLEKDACQLTVRKPYDAFAAELGSSEPGIYLIGLDTHVAFAILDGSGVFRLIHASGSRPWCVVNESQAEAGVLQRSQWRMYGNITADTKTIRRWLRSEKIPVRGA